MNNVEQKWKSSLDTIEWPCPNGCWDDLVEGICVECWYWREWEIVTKSGKLTWEYSWKINRIISENGNIYEVLEVVENKIKFLIIQAWKRKFRVYIWWKYDEEEIKKISLVWDIVQEKLKGKNNFGRLVWINYFSFVLGSFDEVRKNIVKTVATFHKK